MNALLTARPVENGAKEEGGRMPVLRTWKAYLREVVAWIMRGAWSMLARGLSGPEDTNAGEELDQLGDITFETTSKAKNIVSLSSWPCPQP
jgi:hypothetical protein